MAKATKKASKGKSTAGVVGEEMRTFSNRARPSLLREVKTHCASSGIKIYDFLDSAMRRELRA